MTLQQQAELFQPSCHEKRLKRRQDVDHEVDLHNRDHLDSTLPKNVTQYIQILDRELVIAAIAQTLVYICL